MYGHKTVSVVLPTHTESQTIRKVITDFLNTGLVDEVVVVNNNAEPCTNEEVLKTSAKLIYESNQGYGYAIRRGLQEAKGDLIVACEPDNTFMAKDIIKLLAYSDDFEVVLTTRTSKELIWEGANMGLLIRWGNIAVAKMIEFFFNTSLLTDMGSTMKLMSRKAYEELKGSFKIGDSRFNAEFLLLIAIKKIRFIEIPVNYNKRIGKSTITGSKFAATILGIRMVGIIIRYFFIQYFIALSKL